MRLQQEAEQESARAPIFSSSCSASGSISQSGSRSRMLSGIFWILPLRKLASSSTSCQPKQTQEPQPQALQNADNTVCSSFHAKRCNARRSPAALAVQGPAGRQCCCFGVL